MYISSWQIFTGSISQAVREASESGQVEGSDTVWVGPSGDAVIASDPAELGEEYAEYIDRGEVSEYIS